MGGVPVRQQGKWLRSEELFRQALRYLPGGVNSPVRAFKAVGMDPIFIDHGQGSRVYDVDGNQYIDYLGSWGPLILGHRHPRVVEALSRVVREVGTSFGACTELEIELARRVVEAVPSIEVVRMVNSGTEATMSALRLARAYTGRDLIVKFEGCYHGHADHLLIQAGSGALTLGVPTSPGVPQALAQLTLVLPYNDLASVERAFRERGHQIAAVIVEPVAGNMGCIPPQPGFLPGLRDLTRSYGSLLIFDEVMTGFRVAYGGAQELYQVQPDLTCLGKVIGGGLPVAAYGGRREIMEMVAPAGPVYQAGTLSGNPLAMAAGLATLEVLSSASAYGELERLSAKLQAGLEAAGQEAGVSLTVNRVGSMLSVFFTSEPNQPVTDYASATSTNGNRFQEFFRGLLERGIYIAPSAFECWFVSLAHTSEDIDLTVAAAKEALAAGQGQA
ncbi:MAG: glutamate-1-semialdehyde 2,1-aminomutase [Clostridia bacterium]|nr:glutamate-1-semialdehyde 2,1-aminomutase [Clostridia bacterium]